MYDPQTTQLECTGICTVLKQANGLLLAGNDTGTLFVLDPQSGKSLQQFTDHKGSITDIYAVSTCNCMSHDSLTPPTFNRIVIVSCHVLKISLFVFIVGLNLKLREPL